MGRPKVYDHRHTSHRNISMPPSRALAIKRAAQSQGVSSHVLIQRFISAGLCVFAEVEDNDE
jgi:hypothetical protein